MEQQIDLIDSPHRNPAYVLQVGAKDKERLQISQQIYGLETLNFLRRFLLGKDNVSFLDMGCGTGCIAIPIAEIIGPTGGKVLGLDISAEQIRVASETAAEKGIQNVSFMISNGESFQELSEKFDVVFCRFLTIHLQDPMALLETMAKYVKVGGILACEEPTTHQLSCFPKSQAFDEANRLTRALGAKRGVNYDFGEELPLNFLHLPVADVKIKFVQPIIGPSQRKIFAMSFDQIIPQILEHGLAREEELSEIIRGLWELAASDTPYLIAGLRNTQIFGIKKALTIFQDSDDSLTSSKIGVHIDTYNIDEDGFCNFI